LTGRLESAEFPAAPELSGKVGQRSMIEIVVVHKDVLEFDADFLVLKYAQSLHGVDRAAAGRLKGIGVEPKLPKPGGFVFEKTLGTISARRVLFVGVHPLHRFMYKEIREFARGALDFLFQNAPDTKSIALTLHGPGFGLDEIEAFKSEIAGITDAVSSGRFPPQLKAIAFVESDVGRAKRLEVELKALFPEGIIQTDYRGPVRGLKKQTADSLSTAGSNSSSKPRIFVAMPFAAEMDDVFHYGI
jgi:hypothetical protein